MNVIYLTIFNKARNFKIFKICLILNLPKKAFNENTSTGFFQKPSFLFFVSKMWYISLGYSSHHVVSGSFDAEKRSEINFSDVSFKIVIT